MKYCPYCGAGLQAAMIFCPKCGKKFVNAVDSLEASASTTNDVNEIPASTFELSEIVGSTKPSTVPSRARKPSKKKHWGIVLTIVLIAIIVIVGISYGIDVVHTKTVQDAAKSILYLEVYNEADEKVATASGFIIDGGATLVTNFHVIDGAYRIVAYTGDGEDSTVIQNVLAYDEVADLAILECSKRMECPSLELGDSDVVKQGDDVYAIGYPLGVANTMSDGIVSSRYVDENGIDVLQVTAAISSGSSGGALLSKSGRVVGVICASYVDGQNLNIAIPTHYVKKLLNNLTRITLKDLNQSRIPVYTLDYVINHYEELVESTFYVEGWLSTFKVYSNQKAWLYLVGSADEVYYPMTDEDHEGYNYDFTRHEQGKSFRIDYRYHLSAVAPPRLYLGAHVRVLCTSLLEPLDFETPYSYDGIGERIDLLD